MNGIFTSGASLLSSIILTNISNREAGSSGRVTVASELLTSKRQRSGQGLIYLLITDWGTSKLLPKLIKHMMLEVKLEVNILSFSPVIKTNIACIVTALVNDKNNSWIRFDVKLHWSVYSVKTEQQHFAVPLPSWYNLSQSVDHLWYFRNIHTHTHWD